MPILDVRNLSTTIPTRRGLIKAVEHVSFTVEPGECLGIVGESGSGKSVTCRSVLGLLPAPIRTTGEAIFNGTDLIALPEAERVRLRGREIAMIVQDAVSALNPVIRVGEQIAEAMLEHGTVATRSQARERAVELMRQVGIPSAAERARDFPHQFSGGMCQRVVIAAALASKPRLLIADEPTTALDVTIQDQILSLLVELQRELGLSIILVTHDMGVVAQTCQRVAVMYAGQIIETATPEELFANPRHPYTAAILGCVPRLDSGNGERIRPIEGLPPDLANPPSGCRFHPRCPMSRAVCRAEPLPLEQIAEGRTSRCVRHAEMRAGENIWRLAEAAP